MSGEDEMGKIESASSNSGETRKFLDDALREFRTAASPDNRLRSLWKVSQLVENATDNEVYELASIAAVEEDHRLRGEICYTISRSQKPQLKPQLIKILRGMILDKNPYVRRSAIKALGELSGMGEAMIAATDPILDDLNRIKATITSLEENLNYLYATIEELSGVSAQVSLSFPAREFTMDNYMRCWETYLRHEKELLQHHRGRYVAIYGEEIVGIDDDDVKLAKIIYERYGSVEAGAEALICKIEEESEPIQMPPPREIIE